MAVNTNYAQGITEYTPDTSADLSMVMKIARQVIRNVDAFDPLAVFNKMPIDKGTTIEEVVIGLAEAEAYNPDAGADSFFTKVDPNLVVRYYEDWTPLKFRVAYSLNEIRKVLLASTGVEDMATRIVASLTEGDKFDKFTRTKGLFTWGKTQGVLVNKTPAGGLQTTSYKAILQTIKDIISGMKFVNASFNTANLKRRTKADDIYILMPYTVRNAMDVNELASVFNLEKDRLEAHIIEIDEGNDIYIVDQNAVQIYTRLYEMFDFFNKDNLYMHYWLHVDRMYALSALFDGCYVTLTPAE